MINLLSISSNVSHDAAIKYIALFLLTLIGFTDLKYWRIPNLLTLPLALVGILHLLRADSFFWGEYIIASLTLALIFFLTFKINRYAIGMGDVKLLLCLAAIFGFDLFPVIWISSITGLAQGFLFRYYRQIKMVPWGFHLSLVSIVFLLFR